MHTYIHTKHIYNPNTPPLFQATSKASESGKEKNSQNRKKEIKIVFQFSR
jgi:hypothetical protein